MLRFYLKLTEEKSLLIPVKSRVPSAILYASKTWCLNDKEVAILRSTERTMLIAMCGVKLMDRKNTSELVTILGLTSSTAIPAMANALRWFGHVLETEDNPLRMALNV